MDLRICHLYPDLLNLYGDRGNIMTLVRRAEWRGIHAQITETRLGDALDRDADLYFIGGGEDRQQRLAAPDLCRIKGGALRDAVAAGAVVLAVCGGYQLIGHEYRAADGAALEGVGLLDLRTIHPGPGTRRLIGNIVIRESASGQVLVGFENHGGRTTLGPQSRALGTVTAGFGNNGEDRTEGAVSGNVFGTYLHGPLLPKNPWLADHLVELALRRRYGDVRLEPLPDVEEHRAARSAAARAGVRETRPDHASAAPAR